MVVSKRTGGQRVQGWRGKIAKALIAVACLCGVAGILAVAGLWIRGTEKADLTDGNGRFERQVLGTTTDLFSIGVADFDADAMLDVFTTNHSFSSLYLKNLGDLRFEDSRAALGLSSNALFPGAEISRHEPRMTQPGLYMFWLNGEFRLVAHQLDLSHPLEIELDVSGGLLPRTEGNVTVTRHEEIPGEEFPSRIRVRVAGPGQLVLRSLRWAVNGSIRLDPATDLDMVFIGESRVSPDSHSFDLVAGADRHGVAWMDVNDDGHVDALFMDGGEAGLLLQPQPYPVKLGGPDGFGPDTDIPGYVQELCPSRQVRLGDADGDGLTDISIVCGRGRPPRYDHPNEVFVQTGPGRFENRAVELGLDLAGQGKIRWFDAEGDGVPELLWAAKGEIAVFARSDGRFERVFSVPRTGTKLQIAMGDIDGKGGPDFFIAAPAGNSAVLLTGPEGYEVAEPETFGLPRRAFCANFVDIDNDGQDEFHALPGGVFARAAAGSPAFAATGELASGNYVAHCLWFDADNDGAPDLLAALPATDPLTKRAWKRLRGYAEKNRYKGRYTGRVFDPPHWDVSVHHNRAAGDNNWLAVDLAGPQGNATGVGASVTVRTADRTITRRIGQAEGSVASSGHFRAYFGLGQADRIEAMTVTWPDGSEQKVTPPPAINQVVEIGYEGIS